MTIFSSVNFNKAHFDDIFTVEQKTDSKRWGYDRAYNIKRVPFGGLNAEVLTIGGGWCIAVVQNGFDEHIITFRNATNTSIDIISADIYKDGNPNNGRTYRSEKYLKKYTQIAIILHTAIISGYIDINAEKKTA